MNKSMYGLTFLAMTLGVSSVFAQAYPNRAIRFVVGAPAGGQSDLGARLLGGDLLKKLGQPVVVENRTGANGSIGMQAVMSAPADGYTYYFGGVASAIASLTTNPIDASKVFTPVSNFYTGAYFFFYDAKLPINSLSELVSYGKANAGKLNFGSPGATTPNLMMKLVESRTGISTTIVPYKGSPQVSAAILNSEVAFTINALAAYRALVDAGKVKALFVTTPKRSSFLPNIPTATEMGIPNFQIGWANGVWGPAGLPRDITQKVSSEIAASAKNAETAEQIRKIATAEPDGSTAESQLEQYMAEVRFWAEAARVAKYVPES